MGYKVPETRSHSAFKPKPIFPWEREREPPKATQSVCRRRDRSAKIEAPIMCQLRRLPSQVLFLPILFATMKSDTPNLDLLCKPWLPLHLRLHLLPRLPLQKLNRPRPHRLHSRYKHHPPAQPTRAFVCYRASACRSRHGLVTLTASLSAKR